MRKKNALFLKLNTGRIITENQWIEEKAQLLIAATRGTKLTASKRASLVSQLFHPITSEAVRMRDKRARMDGDE